MRGRCLCGAVVFEIAGALPDFYQCHCSQCRKLSGSASDTATFLNRDQFRWRAGEDLIGSYCTASGYRSDFCRTCGSTVPHLMQNGGQYWVPAGLLEGSTTSRVVAHLCVASKADWDEIRDTGERYPGMPDMAVLNQSLQRAE